MPNQTRSDAYYTDPGERIIYVRGVNDALAIAPTLADAARAVAILNRAARDNDRRHYTAAARGYARAETECGLTWTDDLPESCCTEHAAGTDVLCCIKEEES